MDPLDRSVPLRRRLLLLTAAAILPLALMAGVGLYLLVEQQRAQAERTALEITRALSTALDAELRRSITALETLAASSPAFDKPEILRETMLRALEGRTNWYGIVVNLPDGSQLVNTKVPAGQPLPPAADPASVLRVFATGKPVIAPLVRGLLVGWAVPVRVPVMRDGRVAYVLTAGVTPDSLLEVVSRQRLEEGWVVTALDDRGGRVVRWPRQNEYIGTPVSGTLGRMMARGAQEETGLTTTLEGNEVYTAFSRSPQTRWAVALGIPRAQVEAAAWRSLAVFGGGVLLSVAVAVLAALLIARSINRPIAALRDAARRLGQGREPPMVATDIREIREVGRALAQSARDRAQAEAEREDLLRREQSARASAEAANRAKDEFLAMLGHELRNPLGAVANAATLLQQPATPEPVRVEARAIIQRQVAHLARLTDDLLDAGRALMGKIVLQREPVNLARAAAQSLHTLETAGKLARHDVQRDLAEAWIEADAIRLDQVISNLLVNATKYTPAGGHIRVSVAREGREAVLRVADDGVGMAPELAARAFDLFVQGDRDLDRAQGGLGIGLTLVRRLAELHGGSASVKSEGVGRGSEFVVRLPAVERPLDARSRAASQAPAPGRHVLVVEDNDDARETLATLLRLAGHRVDVAADGAEGLEKALALRPDVALVDIGLPRIDGYEVARRVREESRRPPYLIAVTGYGLPEDRERALAAGFDEHLVKPVDNRLLDTLLARIAASVPQPA